LFQQVAEADEMKLQRESKNGPALVDDFAPDFLEFAAQVFDPIAVDDVKLKLAA
jgi:hypothetical protein